MRSAIKVAAFSAVAFGAAGLAAVDTTGSNLALNGSDDLLDVTRQVMTQCASQFSDFTSQNLSYLGGGSSVGAKQLIFNAQQVSPMTRALTYNEFCGATAPGSPGLTESLLVGLDGVAVLANTTNSCSSSAAAGLGSSTSFPVTNDGTSSGGAPATCPGCDASSNYQFADSFDALRVLYFGLMHDGTYDCASPVRKSLVRNWRNVFSSDCAAGDSVCSGGLTHAWRRGDLSGDTNTFVSILGPPGRGIGDVAGSAPPPLDSTARTNPFCNSADANAAPPIVSFAGGSDSQDLDPIRTACVVGHDGVCSPTKFANPTGTLFVGDMGVVLPILVPEIGVNGLLASDLYPSQACGTACTMVAPIRSSRIPTGFKCPGGSPPTAGLCLMPFAGTSANPDPRCVTSHTTHCIDVIPRDDGRQYNLAVVVAASEIPAAARGTNPWQLALDASGRILSAGAFYRVHSTTSGANNVPDPTVPGSGLCAWHDTTSLIGCLVDSDPCSVGYSGRPAARTFPSDDSLLGTFPPQPAPLKGLAINGVAPFTPGSSPDLAITNLLQPPGTQPLYPFAHRLYLTTLYGFGNLQGGESELAQCFATNGLTSPALATDQLVAVPGGVQCLDYPETASTTTPSPATQGSGNVALGGCLGITSGNTDACAVSPIPIR
jgi:hypothetical protein